MRPARTFEQELRETAQAHGQPFDDLAARHIREYFGDEALPERYSRLVTEILLRLPAGWASHAICTVRVGKPEECADRRPGCAILKDDAGPNSPIQIWEVALCVEALDGLSDAAARGAIVHELAHVASALSPSLPYGLLENRADNIAKWCGFGDDLQELGVVY